MQTPAVIDRLRTLRGELLDGHDFAVDALAEYRTITTDEWAATPPQVVKEMFELSASLSAGRLQVLLLMADQIIDSLEFD
jgi:hypothetical protein